MSNIHDVVAIIFAINEVIESVTRQHDIMVTYLNRFFCYKRGCVSTTIKLVLD